MNLLFLSLVILFLLKWDQDRARYGSLYWAILVYALSLGNHFTMILIAPAILFFIYKTDKTVFYRFKRVMILCGVFLIGLSPYILTMHKLYYSHTGIINHAIIFEDIFHVPRLKLLRAYFFYSPGEIILTRLPQLMKLFLREFNYIFVPLLLFAFFQINKKIYLFLMFIFAPIFIFSLSYGVYDIEPFLIPVYFIMTIFLGFSLNHLFMRFNKKSISIVCFHRILKIFIAHVTFF